MDTGGPHLYYPAMHVIFLAFISPSLSIQGGYLFFGVHFYFAMFKFLFHGGLSNIRLDSVGTSFFGEDHRPSPSNSGLGVGFFQSKAHLFQKSI
jgi:hypothetical protein